MLYITAEDWYHVGDRGIAFSVKQLPEAFYKMGYYDPCQLVGKEVMINGHPFTIAGVEDFKIGRWPSFPYRLSVGLLVK